MRNNIAKVRYAVTIDLDRRCFGQQTAVARSGFATLMSLAKTADSTAENALKQEEKKPQYSLQLLKIVAEQSIPVQTRLAASLAFKNFVRLNYVVCQCQYSAAAYIHHLNTTADTN